MVLSEKTSEQNLVEDLLIEFSTNRLDLDDPRMFFEGVADTIASLQEMDANFLSLFSVDVRSSLIIRTMEIGSLRLWLATQLDGIPEKDLHNLDWKRIAGHFLVNARRQVVKFLRQQPKIDRREQIDDLAKSIEEEARTASNQRVTVKRMPRLLVADLLVRFIRSIQSLPGNEQVVIYFDGVAQPLSRDIEVTQSAIDAIRADEAEPFEQEMTLLIKKPDMIGQSQWEFVDRKHVIRARMIDSTWLSDYQQNQVMLKPGDSLIARVRVTPRPTHSEMVYSYEILKVRNVVQSTVAQQNMFPFVDNEHPKKD